MKKLVSFIGIFALLSFSSPALATSYPVGGTQYYLAGAGTNTTATSIQLTSFKTPDGRPITMSMFGTVGYGAIDPQTNEKIEDVTFTGITQNGNGTAAITGVARGIDFVYPFAASTTLAKSHTGGATFILTNTPSFYYDEFAMTNNNNVTATATVPFSVVNKAYVDSVAFSGAGVINANTSNKGVVQIATGQQAASSTLNGSTGAQLVLPASIATSTYNASSSVNVIPVTGASGTIDQNFLPISNILSTSTIYATPVGYVGKNIFVASTTGTSTFSVPSGVTEGEVTVVGGGSSGGHCSSGGTGSDGAGGGSAGGTAIGFVPFVGTTSIAFHVAAGGVGGSPGTGGETSFFGSLLSATGAAATASHNPGVAGIGSGGYLNMAGGGGGIGNGSSVSGSEAIVGSGGSSYLGGGAPGNVSTTANGSNALGYGAGGSGGACTVNSQSANGGNGGGGFIMVRW